MTEVELLPGYYIEPETGAWLSLPWPPPGDLVTLGPQIASWCEEWLTNPRTGEPWRFTKGQLRFLHLWYALDPSSTPDRPKWLYRSGVKRGAKGVGKDPFLAAVVLAELVGPVVPKFSAPAGEWHGESHHMALVQIAANSEAQAGDVLRVANAMANAEMRSAYALDCGIKQTYAGDNSKIELLTKSEESSEGDPATFIALNESHHMTKSNTGQALAGVARRNVGKSPGGMARILEATNSHMPGEGSVAEDSYEAWQAQAAGKTRRQDILYDSREAAPHLGLADEDELIQGIAAAYGDAPWVDQERIMEEAQDPRVPVADAVRYYFSSLPTTVDAWVEPRRFDSRHRELEVIDGEQIALFLDCSKSQDATVLVACRIEDGHVFEIDGWQRPRGERGKGWLAPRHEVDAAVRATFARYDVQWFGVDPSPARDDEDESLYWSTLVDEWHRDFRDQLALWTVPGSKGSAVAFDMRLSVPGGKDRVRLFTEEAERTAAAIDDDEHTEPLTWDGSPMLRQHVHNARRRPNQWGVSIGKQSRSSSKLVDFAVGIVGARLGRRLVLNSGKQRRKRSRKAVFI